MLALGGSFNLQSTPGKGVTARLVLPLNVEHGTANLHHHPQDTNRIPVLLVDDHAMMRQGLRAILESYPDIEVVGEACDGLEAIIAMELLRPRVVLIDVNMPKMNGVEATAEIKSRFPEAIVLGLSAHEEEGTKGAMLQAGASMLITKETAGEQLYRAIQKVVKDTSSRYSE
jgi:DNA-binding NarL/FixJ family response regulator